MLFPLARNEWFSLLAFVFALCLPAVAQGPSIQPGSPPAGRGRSSSVAIIVDGSSAAKYKTERIKKAVAEFMQAFTSEDEACVYVANDNPVLLQDFTGDSALVVGALKGLRAKGKLALYNTLAVALDHLRSDAMNEKAAIVVFTAGNNTSRENVAAVMEKLKAEPRVELYAVAFPGSRVAWQSSLQEIATASGGRAFFPGNNGQVKEASQLAAQGAFGRTADQVALARASDTKPLATYKSIVVRSIPVIESKSTSAAQGGENILLHDVLVARLRKSKLFSEVLDTGNIDVPQSTGPTALQPGQKLELLATLVGVQRGSRFSWKFLASGGTQMKVQVVLRDAATQQPVLSLVQEGSAVSGLLSRGEEQVQSRAVLHAVNGIIAQIRKAK